MIVTYIAYGTFRALRSSSGFVVEERRLTKNRFGMGLPLPEGYSIGWDPDILTSYRGDRSVVAVFSTHGIHPQEITRAAWEDHGRQETGEGP